MPQSNFSQKTAPASQINLFNTTFGDIFRIPQSGNANTCKPKHCGVCGECRQQMWRGAGEIGGDLFGDDYLDYQGPGWLVQGRDPNDTGNPYTAFFSGPAIWKTYAEYEAACPDDGCTSPDGSAGLSPEAVHIPLYFLKNQTDCLAHAATLPSGEVAAWFTTANTYDGYFGSNASYIYPS